MSLLLASNDLYPDSYVIGGTGLGVLGSAVPVSGSLLSNKVSLPADANAEFYLSVTQNPFSSGYFVNELGVPSITLPQIGIKILNYVVYKDGVSIGTFSETYDYSGSSSNEVTLRLDSTEWISNSVLLGDTGLGIPAREILLDTNPSNFLRNTLGTLSLSGEEVRALVVSSTVPAGYLVTEENGQYQILPGASGTFDLVFQVFVDGVLTGGNRTVSISSEAVISAGSFQLAPTNPMFSLLGSGPMVDLTPSLVLDSDDLIPGALTLGNTGLGVLGQDVPVSGFVYDNLTLPADSDKEVRALIISHTFPNGTFSANEDTSFSVTASDGVYSIVYRLFFDGQDFGQFTFSYTVGGSSGLFSLVTEASTFSFSAQSLSSAYLYMITADAQFQLSGGLPLAPATGSFNLTTAHSVLSMYATGVLPAPQLDSEVAIHIGGGVCITTSGKVFTIIM